MSTLLTLQPGSLPSGYCWPSSPQEFYNKMFELGSAVFGGEFQTFNYGPSVPAAEDSSYPWLRVANGLPDSWYVYDSGDWIWPYEIAGSGGDAEDLRWLWVGTTDALKLLGGGEDAAVSDRTGPFWEVDTDFAARIPIGVGVLAESGANITVGSNYGDEEVTLAEANLPSHSHYTQLGIIPLGGASGSGGDNAIVQALGAGQATSLIGSGAAFSIVPQVRGIYLIKRTARIFKRL